MRRPDATCESGAPFCTVAGPVEPAWQLPASVAPEYGSPAISSTYQAA